VNQTSLENANTNSDDTTQNLTNTSKVVVKTVSTSSSPAVYNNTTNITYYNITVKVPYKYWYKKKVKVAHTKYVKYRYRVAYKSYYKTYYKYQGEWYTKYKYTWKYKYTYKWVKKTRYTYKYKWTYKIKYKTVIKQTTTKPSTPTVNDSQSTYLSSSKNCQVNDATIKSLAQSLTKDSTSYTEKATKIFNWVKNNIAYSFYYNTKYGAVKTLLYKKGNCVDHAHLINALMRAVGIKSRYVHINGKFTSGNTYGHVYSEVYIGGKWVKADATSSSNSLGVIKNWVLIKYKGTYASLPF
jgi:transglutaminase-like putative cysteine protease